MTTPATAEKPCDQVIRCPRCGSQNVKREGPRHYAYRYHCLDCNRDFAVLSGGEKG